MQESPLKSGGIRQARSVRRWWSKASFWASLGVVVVILGLLVTMIIRGRMADDQQTQSSNPPPVRSASPSAAVPKGYAKLPAPTGLTDGYPTHYPQTPQGAAAILAGYVTVTFTTLSYDEMPTALNAYVHGGVSDTEAQQAVAGARSLWKISPTGDVPDGTEVSFDVAGTKWRQTDTANTLLSIEGNLIYRAPSGEVRESKFVMIDARVTWSAGRWWVPLDDSNGGHTGDWAEPGTAAFNRAGWRIVTGDAWKGGVF